jgi:catechol 2,3-dioxygenase-like lactoylglutathione lyase family enzyme
MQGFVATKLNEFEQGKISRRKLIETLTLAATTVYASGAQSAAAAEPALKAALVNHISYTCPNFKQAGDWYSKVFNLDQVGLKDTEVTLPFGKKGEKPYGVTAKDVPLTFIICRTRDLNAPPANGQARPQSQAVVNHIAYTIADYDRAKVLAELKRMGFDNPREDGEHSFHIADPFGYDVQISGMNMTALTGG